MVYFCNKTNIGNRMINMYTFLVPSSTTDEEIEEMKRLQYGEYIRVEPMPTYKKKVPLPHWKDNLVKNGVRV